VLSLPAFIPKIDFLRIPGDNGGFLSLLGAALWLGIGEALVRGLNLIPDGRQLPLRCFYLR